MNQEQEPLVKQLDRQTKAFKTFWAQYRYNRHAYFHPDLFVETGDAEEYGMYYSEAEMKEYHQRLMIHAKQNVISVIQAIRGLKIKLRQL